MADARSFPNPDDIAVIAPNLKRRLSGVTATIVRLVPVQAAMIVIVTTGPGLPAGLPHIPLWRTALLPRNRWRVWHARRNTEMLAGLLLRTLFRRRLRLVFTSASQRIHTRFTKWLIARMDGVVATSQRTAGYLDRPATVILHGIDTDRFAPTADRAALRGRLGLPDGLLVGCYGRIRHQKGTDVFLDAVIPQLKTRPDGHALVMGRATGRHGPYLAELRNGAARAGVAGQVHFLPEVPVGDMPDWYRVLDLYVAPQRWEGFGLTPLEAMACGVPVVAARVGAFDELVDDGVTGTIVEPGDPQAMEQAVGALLSDRRRLAEIGAAARARALAGFRIEDEAGALVSLYRGLLAETAAGA